MHLSTLFRLSKSKLYIQGKHISHNEFPYPCYVTNISDFLPPCRGIHSSAWGRILRIQKEKRRGTTNKQIIVTVFQISSGNELKLLPRKSFRFPKSIPFKGKSPCEIIHKGIKGLGVGVLPPGTMLFKRQRRYASENFICLAFPEWFKSLLNNEIIERYAREKENWYVLKISKKCIVIRDKAEWGLKCCYLADLFS